MDTKYDSTIDKICQGGEIKCPICENNFFWSYKMSADVDLNGNIVLLPASIIHTPTQITYVALGEDRVKFLIPCSKCHSTIETSAMNMMDKSEYLKYSNKI